MNFTISFTDTADGNSEVCVLTDAPEGDRSDKPITMSEKLCSVCVGALVEHGVKFDVPLTLHTIQ